MLAGRMCAFRQAAIAVPRGAAMRRLRWSLRVPCRLRWRGMDRHGAASAYGWVGRPALEDRAPSPGRVPLAS